MQFLKRIFSEFIDDDCPAMAAALAYYTVFSLAPLLVVIVAVAGFIFGEQTVRAAIQEQIHTIIGGGAAQQVDTMVLHANQRSSSSLIGTVIGIVVLLFGATTAFAQLQSALNKAWEVMPDPAQGGLWNFFSKRVMSLGMVLGIAFLLLVSLTLSAALSAAGGMIAEMIPGYSSTLLWALNAGLSFMVITVLFAAMFKVLPDAEIGWKDVAVGAVVTSVLFAAGKFGLAFYLGRTDPASGYGAAGSIVLILLWIYYASMILLFGAEFTQVWAETHGAGIRPEKGAVRVHRKRVLDDQQHRPAA
jgi:membrane protein